jgi:hypothetical protein
VALLFELLLPPLFTLVLVLIRNIVVVYVDPPAFNEDVNASLAPTQALPMSVLYDPPTTADDLSDEVVLEFYAKFFATGGASVYMLCQPAWVQNVSQGIINATLASDFEMLLEILLYAAGEFGRLGNGSSSSVSFTPCQQLKTAVLPFNNTAQSSGVASAFRAFVPKHFPFVKEDYLMPFDSSAAFDAYLADADYGDATKGRPGIGAAIIFNDAQAPDTAPSSRRTTTPTTTSTCPSPTSSSTTTSTGSRTTTSSTATRASSRCKRWWTRLPCTRWWRRRLAAVAVAAAAPSAMTAAPLCTPTCTWGRSQRWASSPTRSGPPSARCSRYSWY